MSIPWRGHGFLFILTSLMFRLYHDLLMVRVLRNYTEAVTVLTGCGRLHTENYMSQFGDMSLYCNTTSSIVVLSPLPTGFNALPVVLVLYSLSVLKATGDLRQPLLSIHPS